MGTMQKLCALTLRGAVHGAVMALGAREGGAAAQGVVGLLTNRFRDNSQALTRALNTAHEQAWKALEIALAGDSFWDRCKTFFSSADDKAFREQVRPFLDACPLAELNGREQFRQDCLRELRAASKAGLLTGGVLDPAALAEEAGAFARYDDPKSLLDAEQRALEQAADAIRDAGHVNLAAFVAMRPGDGSPIFVVAARYFFRRQIEQDSKLFQGLAWTQLETLQESQEQGFQGLYQVLVEHQARVEDILSGLKAVARQTRDAVLDIRAEQQRQGDQAQAIYSAVLDLQNRLDLMNPELRPRDSLSIRNDTERQLVKELVGRYRQLPEGQRQRLPALLNAIGKLEVAAGDFQSAQADFARVAGMVGEPSAQAEAHYNAYRAALERRDWDAALDEARTAATLDPARYSPFPLNKYVPKRILGAGGFGVAFLCRHRYMNADVVVKTLTMDDLDRDADTVFGEAQALRQIDHPSIIRIQDCGFASSHDESRPYLVMDYFDGATLEDFAREKPLPVEGLVSVARQMAEGLFAAHSRGILHRDVKPANVLVAQADSQVKIIDFGLALKRTMRETMMASSAMTLTGSSIAGTLDYAAPEQMGKMPGVPVRPASDVYGWAKTCCYALFQTPQPLMRHWRSLPSPLAELLETCLEDQPALRPQDFKSVLEKLSALSPSTAPTTVSVPPTRPTSAAVTLPVVEEKKRAKAAAEMTAEERRHELEALAMKVAGCTRCNQLAKSRTQTVFGEGPLDPEVCFVGEGPGADEDYEGRPFVGASGQVLNGIITAMGLKREEVYICNILKCRPPNNRTPTTTEANNCREFLDRQIELVRPKFLVALGGCAAQNLLGTTLTIGRLRGRFHDLKGIPVLCTYHPAFLLPTRSPEKKKDVWDDMRMLLQRMGRRVP